jgi:peptidoglycan/xylan/chitin deacetylase (PgdA/CDA1 family)
VVAAAQAGHEIADHMWEHRVPKEPELEYDHLVKSTQALERLTGRRPVGTRSHHTPAFLTQLGYIYTSTDTADHLPYYIADAQRQNMLLNLPFHYAIDDAMFFNFGWIGSGMQGQRLADPESVLAIWWEAFEHLYKQGSYLNICLHPFISGRALRTAMLDRLITRMQSLPGVWFTTCEALARYCLEHFPPPHG